MVESKMVSTSKKLVVVGVNKNHTTIQLTLLLGLVGRARLLRPRNAPMGRGGESRRDLQSGSGRRGRSNLDVNLGACLKFRAAAAALRPRPRSSGWGYVAAGTWVLSFYCHYSNIRVYGPIPPPPLSTFHAAFSLAAM